MFYDEEQNLLWLATGNAYIGAYVYKSVPGSGVWTQALQPGNAIYSIYKTSTVLQDNGSSYYIIGLVRLTGSVGFATYTLPLPFDQYGGGSLPDDLITLGQELYGGIGESSISGLLMGSTRDTGLFATADGVNWNIISSPFTNAIPLSQLIETPSGKLYACDFGKVLISEDGGYSWSDETLPGSGSSVYGAAYFPIDEHVYGLTYGNIYESDTRTDMGRSSTCANEVHVTNSRTDLNLTHLFVYEDGVGYSANQIPMAGAFDLFPDPVSANDAVYFGIDTSRQLYGDPPFDNIVFDLATIMLVATSIDLTWEYSQGGAAWETLAVTDHTEAITHPFELAGVRSIHWSPPDDWDIESISGVDALWVRCRVTAVVGGTTSVPSQQTRDVYTTIWPTVLIDELQVPGDIENLSKHTLFMQSDQDGPNGSEPNLWANRVIVGARSIDRGSDFTAYLNCADEQNPISLACTLGSNTSFVDWVDAGPGRASFYQPSGYDAMAMRVRFGMVSTLARQYHGSYRAFLRCTQRVGVSGDIRVRLYIGTPWGSDDYWSDIKSIPSTVTYNKLIDFGEIELPLSQIIADELVATTYIEVHAECTYGGSGAAMATFGTWMSNRIVAPYDTAPQAGFNPTNLDSHLSKELWYDGTTLLDEFPSLYFMDLILIPSDEWVGDFVDASLSASTALSAGRSFDIDSIDYPKTEMRGLVRSVATDAIQAIYVPLAPGPVTLQPNADQRLWFLFDKSESLYTPDWNSSPHIGMSVQSRRVSRYLGMRGSR